MKKRIFILSFALVLLATWCYASYLYLPHRRAAFTGGGNDAYTVLLAHMDGTDDAQVFTDSGAGPNCPHTMTANGNVKTENTQYKFGTTSAYFDGTGDYITLSDSNDYAFGDGDFTIDFWVKPTTAATGETLVGVWDNDSTPASVAWWIQKDDATHLKFVYYAGGSNSNSWTYNWTTDWQHIAIVRNGADLDLYVDGTKIGSTYNISTDVINDSTNFLAIGALSRAAPSALPFTGYIDELRISKGIARWTANFSVPTAAYYE